MAGVAIDPGRNLDFLSNPFIEPGDLNNSQLLFITAIYGVILFKASGLISDGSEMLMFIPSVAGLVGSVVLPILGAVPDGVMTLFSGLGPREEAQESVGVGVGVLAGSTVMLLTFPWFLAITFGRVPLVDQARVDEQKDEKDKQIWRKKIGQADYGRKKQSVGWLGGGVQPDKAVSKNAAIMILTTFSFLVIQIPATMYEQSDGSMYVGQKASDALKHVDEEVKEEHMVALVGLIVSAAAFIGYLALQVLDNNEDKVMSAIIEGVEKGQISLASALDWGTENAMHGEPLLEKKMPENQKTKMKKILNSFFCKYDADRNNSLSCQEFRFLLSDLGEPITENSEQEIQQLFRTFDTDGTNSIDKEEFYDCLWVYMTSKEKQNKLKAKSDADKRVDNACKTIPAYGSQGKVIVSGATPGSLNGTYIEMPQKKNGESVPKYGKVNQVVEYNEAENCWKVGPYVLRLEKQEEKEFKKHAQEGEWKTADGQVCSVEVEIEEEEELPASMKDLSPEEQRKWILIQSSWMMLLGTCIVLFVSDPFVDVLGVWGKRLGVPGFYVSFVVAPFASNASELLAAYNYAVKKTPQDITTSLCNLIGAACMNNSFVLTIFFALIYLQGLAWKFTAETIAIMLVQWVIGGIAYCSKTHTMPIALIIFGCYPLCLFVVYILESPSVGLD